MTSLLPQLVHEFVTPLLSGGVLHVRRPFRVREYRAMVDDLGQLHSGDFTDLLLLRIRRAQDIVANPGLPEPDPEELALWVGLHNILALDHPDRARVWTRSITWERVESVTRSLLTLSQAENFESALVRHVSMGPFLALGRTDRVLATPDGEERYRGQDVPRRKLRRAQLLQLGGREERVHWMDVPHAPEVAGLIHDALWTSPLSCILSPLRAPSSWNPLIAAPFLSQRAFVRRVCYGWARSQRWIEIGGAVTGQLMALFRNQPPPEAPTDAIALPGVQVRRGPREVGAIVGALIHTHFLKVLELGARLGLSTNSRDPSVQMFLALPRLLPQLTPVLGQPLSFASELSNFDTQVARRWAEYTEHLGELIPQAIVENLVATLLPAIVKGPPA